MLSWLFGAQKAHEPSSEAFQGILKYNTVFVTDENLDMLTCRGFGARRLRKVAYHSQYHQQFLANQEGSSSGKEAAAEEEQAFPGSPLATPGDVVATAPATPKEKPEKKAIDTEDKSPMILFDEEAFFLFRMKLLELQHPDGSTVTEQQLWDKLMEKNDRFALKYKVYSYFREQNFVVKSGIHYGLDYAIYRTLPIFSHSELCAMVVDGTTKANLNEGVNSAASDCAIGWREVSTLTRVSPDVMKLLLFCYVLPVSEREEDEKASDEDSDKEEETNETLLSRLFYNSADSACDRKSEVIDFSTPACLEKLYIRPTTTLIRRKPCKGDAYPSIGDIQNEYRAASILRKARTEQVVKKKRRKRRDHKEVRLKAASKHHKVWKQLLQGDDGAKKRKKELKRERAKAVKASMDIEQEKSKSQEKREKIKKKAAMKETKTKSLAEAGEQMKKLESNSPEDLIAMLNAQLAAGNAAAPSTTTSTSATTSNANSSSSTVVVAPPAPVSVAVIETTEIEEKKVDAKTDAIEALPPREKASRKKDVKGTDATDTLIEVPLPPRERSRGRTETKPTSSSTAITTPTVKEKEKPKPKPAPKSTKGTKRKSEEKEAPAPAPRKTTAKATSVAAEPVRRSKRIRS